MSSETTTLMASGTETGSTGDQSTQQQTSSTQQASTNQGQAQTSEPWYSALPDELKANQNITKFQSVAELAKGYHHASQMIGRDKIPMPMTEDEMSEVQVRLGKPQSYEEYKIGPELGHQWVLEDLQDSPEMGVPLEEFKKCFKKKSHEFGFTQNQTAKIYETLVREQSEERKRKQATISAQLNMCEQTLRAAWGEQHDVNLIVAGKTAHGLFGPRVMKIIEDAGLARDPDFIKGMHRIGNKSHEELGIDKRGSALRTPSDLDGEIASLMGHPAYLNKKHPEHAIVMNKVTALMQRRHPD